MNLQYEEAPEATGVLEHLYVATATNCIPWNRIRKGMIVVIGLGDTTGTYLLKAIEGETLTLTEIYFKRGAITITKDRMNQLRPLAFLIVPNPKLMVPAKEGAVYQVYGTGTIVTVIKGRRWLNLVDQSPILLPVIPRMIIRRDAQSTSEGNEQ